MGNHRIGRAKRIHRRRGAWQFAIGIGFAALTHPPPAVSVTGVSEHTHPTIVPPVKTLQWLGDAVDGQLRLLDQTRLPGELAYVDCSTSEQVGEAIRRLAVRGAPAIGVAAAYAVVLAARESRGADQFGAALAEKAAALKGCRPTAVNLAWAVDRVMHSLAGVAADDAAERALAEARKIHREDAAMCRAIGEYAAELIAPCTGVLTHCNAGALATAGIGTATAGMYVARERGERFTVYCDETRPLLQGSRLTAWELMAAGIEAVVITDSMAASVMREGRVQLVVTGADRIAANGDAANKIGTYPLAVLAARHGIDFYVAAPTSTFDLTLGTGGEIPIEHRAAAEITEGFGRRTAPEGVGVYAPAFDVTPAELITGIVTDRGVIRPVTAKNVRKVISTSP